MLKFIEIENVRGISHVKLNLNMYPNKPNILVAPNGSGKTSMALAFAALKQNKLALNDSDVHNGVANNHPSLKIGIDNDSEYHADEQTNDISKNIATFVINSKNKPKVNNRNINGQIISSAKLSVEPIILRSSFPDVVQINDNFKAINNLDRLKSGIVYSIKQYLKKDSFLKIDYDWTCLDNCKVLMRKINSLIDDLAQLDNSLTVLQAKQKISSKYLRRLSDEPKMAGLVAQLRNVAQTPRKEEISYFIDAIQIIKLYEADRHYFTRLRKRYEYENEKEAVKTLFRSLKQTWKGISPKEVGNNFLIEIEDTYQISNGERDIIVFLALLTMAETKLNKQDNILIIDEIFDYLDDANLVSAQYYITKLINKYKDGGRNIYPIILSHLTPAYFKDYCFKDLKIFYFNENSAPVVSNKMKTLIRKRDDLVRNDKQNGTYTDLISKYMLHYHNQPQDVEALRGNAVIGDWMDVSVFKQYCKEQTKEYVENREYDTLAVCVWLRECIEKYLYDNAPDDKKQAIIDEHGTKNKLITATENGIDFPEIYSLLGLIYNDNLHLGNDGKEKSHIALYSKLANNTIKNMINEVVKDTIN